ncbi:uncharacterized protein LOC123307646 [Coccinella septempunctata]|uniref:uncharacterized protein LOC123307646 n=1 Tax=Coccinella septempunctata TaxID=41139 RepID=UPI001D07BF98|nr:uncharacterized protein LOC123307646 [Coccinella septempunctata]
MFFGIFLVLVVVDFCASYDNSSVFSDKIGVMGKSAFSNRQSRLISFNTLDDGISVELDFTVPFITIPVKKSMALAQGSLANINVGAVILAGGLVVGISLIMPLILTFFSKQHIIPSQWKPGYRNAEDRSEIWSQIENILSSQKIDPTSCMQKYICSTISQSLMNIEKGAASSSDKIIDGIASSPWLTEQLHGTSMYFALKNGLGKNNCSDTYKSCGVSEDLFESTFDALQKFVLFGYSNLK